MVCSPLVRALPLYASLAAAFVGPVAAMSHPVFAQGPMRKLSPAAQRMARDARPLPFVVQFRRPATTADLTAITHAGATVTRRYERMSMVAIKTPGTTLAKLAALSNVTRISPDTTVASAKSTSPPGAAAANTGDTAIMIHGE